MRLCQRLQRVPRMTDDGALGVKPIETKGFALAAATNGDRRSGGSSRVTRLANHHNRYTRASEASLWQPGVSSVHGWHILAPLASKASAGQISAELCRTAVAPWVCFLTILVHLYPAIISGYRVTIGFDGLNDYNRFLLSLPIPSLKKSQNLDILGSLRP